LDSIGYSEFLVRSRRAMRCQEMPRGDTVIGFAVGIGAHSRPEVSRLPPLFHSGFRANGCHWARLGAILSLFKSA
jgi:hypothetical protein